MRVPHASLTALALAAAISAATGITQAPAVPASRAASRASSRGAPRTIAGVTARVRDKLAALHAAGRFPGATVGVAFADGTSCSVAAGLADRERNVPMKPEDRMLAGSVGKTFFAAVALRLIADGKLSLDDPIRKHLGDEPWFARLPNGADATMRQLMNHTSGLVRYEFKPAFARDLTAQPDKTWKPEELVAYVLGSAPPFAAGERFEYSDTNYIVLGMIVERVARKSCYALIEEQVLKPLKLEHTSPADRRVLPGLIQGYAGKDNPFGGTDAVLEADGRFVVNPQFEWAGGGFVATSEDLARWARALWGGDAIPATLRDTVRDGVVAPMLGRGAKYGLGVILRDTRLGPSLGHSGFFPGYVTEVAWFPEHGMAVALQVNTSVFRDLGRSSFGLLVELAGAIPE